MWCKKLLYSRRKIQLLGNIICKGFFFNNQQNIWCKLKKAFGQNPLTLIRRDRVWKLWWVLVILLLLVKEKNRWIELLYCLGFKACCEALTHVICSAVICCLYFNKSKTVDLNCCVVVFYCQTGLKVDSWSFMVSTFIILAIKIIYKTVNVLILLYWIWHERFVKWHECQSKFKLSVLNASKFDIKKLKPTMWWYFQRVCVCLYQMNSLLKQKVNCSSLIIYFCQKPATFGAKKSNWCKYIRQKLRS